MKTKSCKHIQEAIYFGPDEIRTCCQRYFSEGKIKGDATLISVKDNKNTISYEDIIAAKMSLIQKINADEESDCKGCPHIENKEWEKIEKSRIKLISIENHSLCNMKCTYCSPLYFGGVKPKYDIMKALDKADVNNKELLVAWGGGEPTARKDFGELFKKFYNNFLPKSQRVFTNGLLYSPELQKAINESNCAITTSIDAGTEETFIKVRKSKGLRKVISNLERYSEERPELVTIKYILTDDNYNIQELDEFVNLMANSNLLRSHFLISTDFKDEALSEAKIFSGLYLYCRLLSKNVNALNMDDHFFNRIEKSTSLFALLLELNEKYGNSNQWIEQLGKNLQRFNLNNVVIWGSGQQCRLILNRIQEQSESNFDVKAIIDANPSRWGQKINGYDIISPEAIPPKANIIIGSSNYYSDIYQQIISQKIEPTRIIPNIFV